MGISVNPELERRLRNRADAHGLSIDALLDALLRADEEARAELEQLAGDGIDSGEPIEIGPGYWEEKHRRLDERLKPDQR
jgi:plasmid stability protein